MASRSIYFDSRSRDVGRPASCCFVLSRGLHNVTNVQIRSFSFANTLYNVDQFSNQLAVTNVDIGAVYPILIPPGFYSAIDFVKVLNTQLRQVSPGNDVVTMKGNVLTWELPSMSLILGGTMSDTLGLYYPYPKGAFTTNLNLSLPQAISVMCAEIQSTTERISCDKASVGRYTPMLTFHLQRGNGFVEVYQPTTTYTNLVTMRNTDRMSFVLVDPRTDRILYEIGSWSLILQVTSE